MFADNQKISKRQMTRLLIYDVFGISTLILPQKLAQSSGNLGMIGMLLAAFLTYAYLCTLGRIQTSEKEQWSKAGCKIVQLLYLLLFIGLAGYTVSLFAEVMHRFLLEGESFLVLAGTILVLAGYGIVQGIEGRARVYELLFWFLLVPLIVMLILALRDVNPRYYPAAVHTDVWALLSGTGMSFVSFILLLFAGFLGRFEQKRGDAIAGAKSALAVVCGLNLIIYVILIGVFGQEALGAMESPVLVLMSMVKLPGGFLKRQDAFMVAIWFFTLYALINSCIFYGNEMLKGMIGKKGNKRYIIVTLLFVYVLAKGWYDNHWKLEQYLPYLIMAALGIILIIPLIIYLTDR